ncbi:MAG: DUF4331 family protein [Myxococcales bacterium]|nr:DUF4331 family protein [Myxococcales bacterium]
MKRPLVMTGLVAVLATATSGAWAADHTDAPATTADPAADITDVYAWMESDASKLNLVMNVFPAADMTSNFSTSVVYAFHVMNVDANANRTNHDVLCTFASGTSVQCWVTDANGTQDYVTGDPTATAGIDSASGAVKVFAGLRNDPFFFNAAGFGAALGAVAGAGNLNPNSEGCPTVDATLSGQLVGLLSSTNGGAAVDSFAGANVLSIVVQLDKTLVNADGAVVEIWGATHATN